MRTVFRSIVLTFTFLAAAGWGFAQAPVRTFTEPVISGFHPDPSICRVGSDYYLVNSTFEYFPGVPVYHSRDLVNWRLIGYCMTRESQLKLTSIGSSGGIFAPTIRYNKGTFYMVCTVVYGQGNFYVTAKNPAGPWSEPVWLDQEGIDPSLFFDDDGKIYYTRHVGGGDGYIGQTTLDLKTGKLEGALQEIWRGTGGIWPEGPHLYKIKKKYYLMIAEGGTSYDHRVTIASSDSPMGPYTANPANPVLTHRQNGKLPIQALGHADMVETPDGWWGVCLGIRPQGGSFHHLGRETFLFPVTWTKEGWPVMGTNGGIDLTMPAPRLKEATWPAEAERDEFKGKELGLAWNYLRNPHSVDYSLSERPGFLRLKGSTLSLNNPYDSPAFAARRQEHLTCRISTKISFDPGKENEEAGLVIRGNEKNHYEIAVGLSEGKRVIIYRWVRNKKVFKEQKFEAPGTEDVVLIVNATPLEYQFAFQLAGGSEQPVNSADGPAGIARTQDLSSEKIGGFTGVFIGLYATGNGTACETPADFDWFEYKVTGK
jgi:xylan 1,4-beta-xylosidase